VRDAIVRPRTRYISLIRALLRQQGYRVPSGSAEGFLHRVLAMTLPGRLLSSIAPLLCGTSTTSSPSPTRRSSPWPLPMSASSACAPSPASGP
jgi:hypothetical protein